jgi:hypothetical protein
MPDFSQLTKRPAGEAKRPPALPVADMNGIIVSYELGDANQNNTPYARFHVKLTDWGNAPESWSIVDAKTGKVTECSQNDVDLSKRQMRRDMFLTDDALWRLDEMIRSLGIEPSGMTYEEVLPQMVGKTVLVEVQQYVNKNTGEVGNQIGKLVGA